MGEKCNFFTTEKVIYLRISDIAILKSLMAEVNDPNQITSQSVTFHSADQTNIVDRVSLIGLETKL